MARCLNNCFSRPSSTFSATQPKKGSNGRTKQDAASDIILEVELPNEANPRPLNLSVGGIMPFADKKRGKLVSTKSMESCASCNIEKKGKDSKDNYLRNVMKLKGYVLGPELGRGSFAVVRKAREVEEKRKLAVKIVDCSKAPEDFITHFFPRELSIIRKLKHDCVVEIVDVVKVNWYTCIIMERADGGDILDYLVKNGPMNDDVASMVFKQAMTGLHYCHDLNIAHRDLKCENVLLTKDNQVKLADFGFARHVVNKDNMRVLSETYCGSAAYAAPEVLQGRPYNPLMSDMWSMGVVLYIMVCAVMPFNDASHRKMLADQRNKRWSFTPDRRSQISPHCRRLVRHLLEPDLTQRATMRLVQTSPWLSRSTTEDFVGDLASVARKGRAEG